jgi:hypothetical protein
VREFLSTLDGYPMQKGSSLNAAGINYGTLENLDAMRRLRELENIARPNN